MQRLVVRRRDGGVDPAGVGEHSGQPVPRRVAGEHHEAQQHGGDEGRHGRAQGPEPACDQQIRHEDQRCELDSGRDADPDSRAATMIASAQVPQHDNEQDHLLSGALVA